MDHETRIDRPSRIVVVDDHPIMRSALRRMLDAQGALTVVGEAADGQSAVELCHRLYPDLVLMDVRMPKMDGLEATRRIRRECPRIIVLILSASDDPHDLSEALKAGASGYALKGAPIAHTIDAVRKVLAGESALEQGASTRLLMQGERCLPMVELPAADRRYQCPVGLQARLHGAGEVQAHGR
jgi:DNA-binding NarL/FixJ family response regulator